MMPFRCSSDSLRRAREAAKCGDGPRARRLMLRALVEELGELAHRNDAGVDWPLVLECLEGIDVDDVIRESTLSPIVVAAEGVGR